MHSFTMLLLPLLPLRAALAFTLARTHHNHGARPSSNSVPRTLLFADLPQNSFRSNEDHSNHDMIISDSSKKTANDRKYATEAFGIAALAAAGAAVLTTSTNTLDASLSIPDLTAHLQHMEQSLQAIVSNAPTLSNTLFDQVSQQVNLLQALLSTQTSQWKEILNQASFSVSATPAHAMAKLETVTSALLTQMEAVQRLLQDQVATGLYNVKDSLAAQWTSLQTTLDDCQMTLRNFHQDAVLPALHIAQTTAQETIQVAQSVAQEYQFRAQFQWALWDDAFTMTLQEWQATCQQYYQDDIRAAAAVQASLALKLAQLQESLIPQHMATAKQLAAQAVQSAQTTHHAIAGQLVTTIASSETEVTMKLHEFQDALETSVAQATVAVQQSGLDSTATKFQQQLQDSWSHVDDTVVLAMNALAATKATADVSFAALEQWLPGYTATVHAILTERADVLSNAVWGNAAGETGTSLQQQQQALVLELLFQLKTTMHAKLDVLLLSSSTSHENTMNDGTKAHQMVTQVAAANAQLRILQDSLQLPVVSSKTPQALELLTSSTEEKLAAVSSSLLLMMRPMTPTSVDTTLTASLWEASTGTDSETALEPTEWQGIAAKHHPNY